MNVAERVELIRQVGEEIVTEDELRALLEQKPHPICYDGFEPSGRIHIAQGVLRAINVNKMTKAGCTFKMFVADWHAWANNKMGGDLEKIQTVGKYFVEVWRAAGMDLEHVRFIWASEFVTDEAYWKKVMNIARDSSLDRILRTTQIMGRSEKDKLSASQILYPCMQAADIFHLEADITQLGMDQRKVNMLAREVGPKLGLWKPVVVSHHMLMGLQQPPPEAQAVSVKHARETLAKHFLYARDLLALPQTRAVIDTAEGRITYTHPVRAGMDDIVIREFGKDIFALLVETDAPLTDAQNALKTKAAEGASDLEPERTRVQEWLSLRRLLEQAVEQMERFGKSQSAATTERAIAMKMSKSNPDSAIFMTDTPADVERKMKNAYCPPKHVEENPVLEYFRYIVFQRHWANARTGKLGESPVTIERPEKFGGNVTYNSYADLERDFAEGKLHPMDAKKAAARYVNEVLQPVREHFEKNEAAKALKQQVDSWQVTR